MLGDKAFKVYLMKGFSALLIIVKKRPQRCDLFYFLGQKSKPELSDQVLGIHMYLSDT